MGPREGTIGTFLDSVQRDARHALRGLLRMPAVTLVAIPTLTLAIGATTALFSFADALFLRPMPVRDPGQLVTLFHVSTTGPRTYGAFSYPDFLDLREARRTTGLQDVSAYDDIRVELGDAPKAAPVAAAIVSGNYFSLLGVQPLMGRTFAPDEDVTPGTHPVVILSEALWASHFGADRSIVGRTVTLDGHPFTVIGVATRSTPAPDLSSDPQLWVPLMMHAVVMPNFRAWGLDLFSNRGTQWLTLVGRLSPGGSRERTARALVAIARRTAEQFPQADRGWTIATLPLASTRAGSPGASPVPRIVVLTAAVVIMVLLMACANIANLLLARATVREREMAVRSALGASRARLARQVLTEALLLAALGAAAGVVLAVWMMSAFPALGLLSGLPALHVRLDARVLAFALATMLTAGLVSGLAPALRASTAGVARGGVTSPVTPAAGRHRPNVHQTLVIVQVAVSLVLLVGAGLMLRTLWNLNAIPLGFDAADVATARVDVPQKGYDAGTPGIPGTGTTAADGAAWGRVAESVRGLPGVRATALAALPPFSWWSMANDFFWQPPGSGSPVRFNVRLNVVDGAYFATMRIRLLAGRTFTSADLPGAGLVAVVNQALARHLWPGQSALGQRLWEVNPRSPATPGRVVEVVGVVSDGRYYRAWRDADLPFLFLPVSQNPQPTMFVHVRGIASALPASDAVRRAVWSAEPSWTVAAVHGVGQARAAAVAVQSATARLLTLFALLGGVIAVVGIYGVVSFTVSRRTREFAVRMALGAGVVDVRRAVLARSAWPILVGTGLGWLVAMGLSRFLSSLLFGISPGDPGTFAAVAVVFVAVGLLAALVPARRATRVDPVVALRAE